MAPSGGDAARPVAEPVARDHHLPDDLAGGEVAHQALRAGVAERAGQRAADLARHAQGRAAGLRDIDALDLVRPLAGVLAGQAQQPFARAVDRDLLGDHFGPLQREALIERGAQLLRHAGHLVEARDAADVDPVPQLLHAHLALLVRHADRAERLGEHRARHPDQRGLRRRDVALERGLLDEAARGRVLLKDRGHQPDVGLVSTQNQPFVARWPAKPVPAGGGDGHDASRHLHSCATRSSACARPRRL